MAIQRMQVLPNYKKNYAIIPLQDIEKALVEGASQETKVLVDYTSADNGQVQNKCEKAKEMIMGMPYK